MERKKEKTVSTYRDTDFDPVLRQFYSRSLNQKLRDRNLVKYETPTKQEETPIYFVRLMGNITCTQKDIYIDEFTEEYSVTRDHKCTMS